MRGLVRPFPARSPREALAERLGLLLSRRITLGIAQTFSSLVLLVTGDRNMMTFLATSNEEDLLTREVSDEALEAAGANEVVGNYTLAACTGLSVCPG